MPLGTPLGGHERLNEIFRPTIHNAFDPAKASKLTTVLQASSDVEIDFWDDRIWPSTGALPHAWFVRHGPAQGNQSNGRAPGDLRHCLLDLRDYLKDKPAPYGSFIFLDKQQGWGETRRPADLDVVLEELFGDTILRPRDLLGDAASLREAVVQRHWCALEALKGRVCFILTGGRWSLLPNVADSNSVLATYTTRGKEAACFVAPEIRQASEVQGLPPGFHELAAKWVVFYNFSTEQLPLAKAVRSAGYLSRVYQPMGHADTDAAYRQCIDAKAHFIATDAFAERTWNDGLMTGRLPD